MKFSSACVLAYAAAVYAAPAQPIPDSDADCSTFLYQGHQHHKRQVVYKQVYVTVTASGSDNPAGALVLTPGPEKEPEAAAKASTTSTTSPDPAQAAPTTPAAATTTSQPPAAAPSTSSQAPSSDSGSHSGSGSGSSSGLLSPFQELTQEFEDGVLDCNSFPKFQGVVALDRLGFGGWSGIQKPLANPGVSYFETLNSWSEGAYLSYACQTGMSKTQWKQDQPSTGESAGGLLCKNGKLYRTNTSTKKLCEWGGDFATVRNDLDKVVAICRTDYPGTENMVVPTIAQPGSSVPITVVNQDTYFHWKGLPTSAQYYVNNAGVSEADGCVWGTPGSNLGNWSPLVFGAGFNTDAKGNPISWLSIKTNPNNLNGANYNVEILPVGNLKVSTECAYVDGKFTDGSDGCNVSVVGGKAQFVFSAKGPRTSKSS